MTTFKHKPTTVEAITFDELVKYGIDSGSETLLGFPTLFKYNGSTVIRVRHWADHDYLIKTKYGDLYIDSGKVLVNDNGVMSIWEEECFYKNYEQIKTIKNNEISNTQ